ncbi:MAG: class I SAM-dependent methyltransferase [Flavisolibacter sp.]|nr:class I SAM-dependent methyltransferase [Flavisolibacter sp.]
MQYIDVHDTAFVTAYFRSLYKDVSQDKYASIWIRESTKKWADEYCRLVSEWEPILHCIRNRYFLDKLTEISKAEDFLLINIGAGFSMYPQTLKASITTIEADLKDIIAFKKNKVVKSVAEGLLPARQLYFSACDIAAHDGLTQLKEQINQLKGTHKLIILIEGVLFFLEKENIKNLFNFCNTIQKQGDLLFSVSYDKAIEEKDVFYRLKNYFEINLSSRNNPYTTLKPPFYSALNNYSLLEHTSGYDYGLQLQVINDAAEPELLNEHFFTMMRN